LDWYTVFIIRALDGRFPTAGYWTGTMHWRRSVA
jgi:hypothetical protein